MSHTFSSNLVHCVFSTKERRPFISDEIREGLYGYMGGIARKNGAKAIAIGGTTDHVHLLLLVSTSAAVADVMREIKSGSSRWVREMRREFEWQEGYGSFSVEISQLNATVEYIRGQAEHHRKRTFQEEFVSFLEKHGIEYDPDLIWSSRP
jgi:putative transposase